MTDALNIILSYMKCLADFSLFCVFSNQFFPYRWEKHKCMTFGILATLSMCLYLTNLVGIPEVNTLVSIGCASIINLLLFQGSIISRLLCAIGEVLLIIICEFIPLCVDAVFTKSNLAHITFSNIQNAGFNLISTGIFCMLVLLIRHVIITKYPKEYGLHMKENLAIITVPLVSIFLTYYILYLNSLKAVVYESNATISGLFAFLCILMMNAAAIIGDNTTKKQYHLQRELDRLHQREQLGQMVINQQEQFIEELKGFSHDYVKQVEGIRDLISQEQSKRTLSSEIHTYANELYQSIEENFVFAFIPTPALRSILSQIQIRCNAEKIKFETDIQYADFSFISFPDLYAIFENSLTNALEACTAVGDGVEKYIKLLIFKKNHMVWVKITNTRSAPVVIKNNMFLSTKRESDQHGHGIKNMQKAVKRYRGYSNIEYTESEFIVTISFPT